jgi:hypothetical protein
MIVSALPILLYNLWGFLPNFDLLDKNKAVLQGVRHILFQYVESQVSHHIMYLEAL